MTDLWCQHGQHFVDEEQFRIRGQRVGVSGHANVYPNNEGSWRAYARTRDKGRVYVGSYQTIEQAVAARDAHTTDHSDRETICMECMGRKERKKPEPNAAMDAFLVRPVL
jgi:hypothetical protein